MKESVLQKQSEDYIMGILLTCFQLDVEEADNLYRECAGIRLVVG